MTRPGRSARTQLLTLLPHALTALRLASAPLLVVAILWGWRPAAAGLMAFAMATDAADGPLARHFGRPSRAGAWFDVGADLAVILAVFGALAAAGTLSPWLLGPIVLSFLVFAATARRRVVMYDPVGRYIGGILMVLGFLALLVEDTVALGAIGWTAAAATGITIVIRLIAVYRPEH